jgi:TonB family protein
MLLTFLLLLSAAHAAEPAPGAPAAEEAAPIVELPRIVTYVDAPYPEEASALGLEAEVGMQITLSAEGVVEHVEVTRPAGHGFDEAAVDAVLAMEWAPARTAEGPIATTFEFTYNFAFVPVEDPPPAEVPINLEGTVIEMATRNPVSRAQITVVGTDLTTETDDEGRFALRGVAPGKVVLRLIHPGHVVEDRTVEVVEGEATVVRLWLRAVEYRDDELVGLYDPPKDEVTRRTITMGEIERIPGTFGDPVRVVQTLPGAARSPFSTGLLIIRGADPEDSGVYIDGIRVPIIYHLTGATSVLSPDIIDAVDYLPGGYGVQYGRTMGGTVDVRTKRDIAPGHRITWGTDILDSQVYYEGRVGKHDGHGLAMGVRRSYIDVFLPLFTGDQDFTLKPRYFDYQLKWLPRISDRTTFSAFLYGFQDILDVATPEDVAQGPDQDTQGDLRIAYSTHRIQFLLRHEVSDRLAFEVSPAIGRDGSDNHLGTEFSLTNANWTAHLRGQVEIAPSPALQLVAGIDAFALAWSFAFDSPLGLDSFNDPLAEREPQGFEGNGTGFLPDTFVRANVRPFGGSDRWLIAPGLRFNVYTIDARGSVTGAEDPPVVVETSVDPRLLTRVQVVPDALTMKASTGLYHQPPQPNEALGLGTVSNVDFEVSWNTSAGWEQQITKAVSYDVEGFYRRMDDLVVFDPDWTGFGDEAFYNGGEGRAYGVEVLLRHAPVNRLFGWVSYTLSRASRRDPAACETTDPDATENDFLGTGPCWYLFDFDQTHIFSAQAGYDLPFDFGISAQVQYVTGNPFDRFDGGVYDVDVDQYSGVQVSTENGERVPPYFQTSLRFDYLFTFKRWQLETYVDFLNIIRGVNPEFPQYNYDYTELAFVRGIPFVPNIGIEARFFP